MTAVVSLFDMTDIPESIWNDLTDELTEELLARASGGEAIFCEGLVLLAAA
jgi:hypothetical protein